jgi:hypothetical protein
MTDELQNSRTAPLGSLAPKYCKEGTERSRCLSSGLKTREKVPARFIQCRSGSISPALSAGSYSTWVDGGRFLHEFAKHYDRHPTEARVSLLPLMTLNLRYPIFLR